MDKVKIDKLIFLDFDGVIVTRKTRYNHFDSECMEFLKELVDETNAFIVISSTWKHGNSFRVLRALFEPFGMFDRIIGVTPNLNGDWVRGQEIDKWLKEPELMISSDKFELDVKGFVILDDDSDMIPHMDKLVQVEPDQGLTKEDVKNAMKLLDL